MPLDFSGVVISTPLVSLEDAKRHLRITGTDDDDDISEKVRTAQMAVLRYLTTAGDATWDATTVPDDVKGAILLLTANYWRYRGDDIIGAADGSAPDATTWDAVGRLLAFRRDPTLA
jgi:hypothetical protein